MTRKEAREAIKEAYGNSEYTDEIIKALEQEPCEDVISRQAVLDLIADYDLSMGQVVKAIHSLPSVTPQEPRKGHWEHGKELSKEYRGRILVDVTYADWHCSNCNYVIKGTVKPKWNYCPNCGADMREVQNDKRRN